MIEMVKGGKLKEYKIETWPKVGREREMGKKRDTKREGYEREKANMGWKRRRVWSENKLEKGQIRWRMEKQEKGLTEMEKEKRKMMSE